MIDITARCGIARKGSWKSDVLKLELPGILYFASSRFQPPEFAEALIATSPISDKRPVIVDRGSVFYPRDGPEDISIPPDFALPPGLSALEIEGQDESVFQVVAGPEGVTASKAEVYVFGGVASLLRNPREFVEKTICLRKSIGPNSILYAPGIALPSNLATLVYCGVDIIDSVAVLYEASRNKWLNPDGGWDADELSHPPCRCSGCLSGGRKKGMKEHNEISLWQEMQLVRNNIISCNLREHIERRAVNSPWNTAVLRHLDLRHYDFQETHFPVIGKSVKAYSHQSLTRPEIVRFRRRIRERFIKPPSPKVLLLLPCSAKKPYSLSKSHRQFREAVRSCGNPWAVHEVIVTSPLGIVPREVELTYPAAHYDIPVTGDWNADEVSIVNMDLESFITKNKYEHIIAHLDIEKKFVEDALGEAIFTCRGRATDDSSLSSLVDKLNKATENIERVDSFERKLEDMIALARFQFGHGGEILLENANLRGRYPEVRIIQDGKQMAMLTKRGLLSLTLHGGRMLSERNLYCVEIDDFYPQGSVFAIGVDGASSDVRIGDDVVVRHKGDVRAVGVAQMSSTEMVESNRGEAVKVRHYVKSKSI